MLDRDEQITFVPELVEIIQAFLHEYEERKGPFRNDLERGLVISFALGVMHCDLEAVWEGLGQAKVFGELHPRVVFEECVGSDLEISGSRRQRIADELRRRGWLGEPRDEGL
ncbi:MAG: hypothetical protein H5T69_03455 [Chloroflexi bacterium]|nr:hypothetical protein [Chloroflexota bacterium]